MEDLVIIGAGGFGREVQQWTEDVNADKPRFRIVGYLDGDATLHGTFIHDLPVLGDVDWLDQHRSVAAAIAIGSPKIKRRMAERAAGWGIHYPAIVHPTAVVGRFVSIADGVIVCPGVIVTTDIRLERWVHLNIQTTIGHDCVLGQYVTVAPGCFVSGKVNLLEGSELGTGVDVVPGVSVGPWSMVGAGAVVSADVPRNVTAVGIPAKVIKTRPDGWQLS